MIGWSKPLSFTLAGVFVTSVMLVSGQQPPATGPFTVDQANAGRAAFQTNCAGCHGNDLMGYPPLAGPAFVGSWGSRNTRDLFGLIQTTMPSDRPGSLPADTYVNIVAYILQSNGRTPALKR
jgi:mono/diheme cytochrome c family protein